MTNFSDADLQAFLDEALPPAQMASIESQLRDNRALRDRVVALRGMQDAGVHSIAAIWRRHRLSCPSREDLGQMLLGVMDEDSEAYIRFHIDRIGCRICEANLADLRQQSQEKCESTAHRRRRYFETSVGRMKS